MRCALWRISRRSASDRSRKASASPFDPENPKPAALACADRTEKFIAQFDVPKTLKAAGVPRSEIKEIVGPITHELEHNGVVDRPLSEAEVQSLLESCYE